MTRTDAAPDRVSMVGFIHDSRHINLWESKITTNLMVGFIHDSRHINLWESKITTNLSIKTNHATEHWFEKSLFQEKSYSKNWMHFGLTLQRGSYPVIHTRNYRVRFAWPSDSNRVLSPLLLYSV